MSSHQNPVRGASVVEPTRTAPKRAEQPQDAVTPVPGFGRIPVTNVSPVVEAGRYPAKAVVDEWFPVSANVFREGHDAVNATVVLTAPDGRRRSFPMSQQEPMGLDIWQGWAQADAEGDWTLQVEGWSDVWGTVHHNAVAKLQADVDRELVCLELADVARQAAEHAREAGDETTAALLEAKAAAFLPELPANELLEMAQSGSLARAMEEHGPRELVSPTQPYPLRVDRRRALFSSWYEFFPRSQGAWWDEAGQQWHSGTFDSSHERLEAAAAMGFDIVYLPPIHPIGKAFRKGRNNSLTPSEQDPGSPWAIGSAEGGHDAVHPDLGTLEDFDAFVAKAKSLGLEIALDFALQASPDHPWVTEHPEWFTTRLDGTIAYAENPPKKYQDIYPINFDNDREGIYRECLRLLRFWIGHGVTVFRVDNPHTKPVDFWAWIMDQVHQTNPEVIFLAEAFTRPEMMHALGKVGFHQSYTYFTWRNAKWELEAYLNELSRDSADCYRPNFFVSTPDINPAFLHSGNPTAFSIRAILAATMSPSWGVYSGFELCEHEVFRAGGEEYLNSEKYEYRPRDWNSQPNLSMLIGRLNEIRRQHPALQQLRKIDFHHAPNEQVIVYSKTEGEDRVIVVCSLEPWNAVTSEIYLDMSKLGLDPGAVFEVHDELSGQSWTWGSRAFVSLHPGSPAHIFSVRTR
ncbi:alpha-1,4-glucan--maltose-1-phosphate maltosyltransferase [Luteococcus peritonei]|uniref:Alpha-1,4-glucan:maltose-1-phosphate maltosyltransferase n=1 Tax=Luteococcus peritonei TaxID=88874 RepID=A0ABW4S019_9ACTN